MHITGPSNARQGERIIVTAGSLPTGAEQVKFNATGNIGFDIVSVSGGSASFTLALDFSGTTTIEAIAQDKFGGTLASANHSISVQNTPFDSRRLGMGGSLSGITQAVVGTMTDIIAQGYGESEQVEFSASNADMGWMMPQPIAIGGSVAASVRLTTEGLATITATFKDKLGNILGNASHAIQVTADPAKRPVSTGPRLGMGGSLSGITEAIVGAMADIQATGYGDTTQVEFSASNAEMGWMMPVQISPGGSTSASVKLTAEGVATVFATFKDSMGTILGQAQHSIRVVADPARKPGPTDMASLMNARAEQIMNKLARKS
ncbi:MAG: hypothetical protein B7X53_04220 [Hyphomonas sp. 34-62-18]|nr:hypothetical protein [Hyphomonas sp. 34-62-18]OZB18112.1 MAG: hypothetical protein B7X53_04220 [Hyphomonas sp. 34-62-18]